MTALNAYFLKHEMIAANRGVIGVAFKTGEIEKDNEALEAAKLLGKRLIELETILGGK